MWKINYTRIIRASYLRGREPAKRERLHWYEWRFVRVCEHRLHHCSQLLLSQVPFDVCVYVILFRRARVLNVTLHDTETWCVALADLHKVYVFATCYTCNAMCLHTLLYELCDY